MKRKPKKLGEQIRDEVAGLPGITLTTLKAVRPYEIGIEVSETTLRQYGLTFDQITRAIRRSSVDLSAGSVKTENRSHFCCAPTTKLTITRTTPPLPL